MKTINKRRAIRVKKQTNDKTLLQMEREVNALYRQKYSMPLIKLAKPIHNGYVRTLVLREDIARSPAGADLERICKRLNVPMYCRRADFKAKKHGKKTFEEIPHAIPPIQERAWDKLNWPEHFKKYFQFATRYYTLAGGYTHSMTGYWFLRDWMFETKVDKHFLTHYREVDPDLESKIAELEKKVWGDEKARARLTKLHGHRGRMADEWNRSEEYHREYLKLVKEQIKEFEDPHLEKEYDWRK